MRAMRVHELGAPMALDVMPVPEPGPNELRIRVHACGVNFADTLMVQGRYQERPELPFVPGMEVAGVVDAIGATVRSAEPGMRVAAFTGSGGFADYLIASPTACVAIPDGMPDEEAAAFLIAYGTSHVALDYKARLKPGETLLVLGAAGGVGLTAVELGKLMGATVIACARGADKLAVARDAGADHLIDSETDDIRDAVKALGGADVVYDPVGGAQFDAALRATKPGGRVLPLGFASGEVPQIPANIILVKNISVLGLYWGAYASLDPSVLTNSFRQLFDWYAEGRLKPHVSNRLPLERANEALALLSERRATGKVVVTME